jgi:hypothetical protein
MTLKQLFTTTFIKEEMEQWREVEYLNYATQVESKIADAFSSSVWKPNSNSNK